LFPRDVLNRLMWEEGKSLSDAEVVILHRGAPNDRMRIPGKDVVSIGHMFFDTRDASIPFHRILEIWYRGERVFEKKERRKTKD
jgi:uncharacterized protein (UPF0248 family)